MLDSFILHHMVIQNQVAMLLREIGSSLSSKLLWSGTSIFLIGSLES